MIWRKLHNKTEDVLLCWEGEQHAVFYDPASGDTHLVSSLAGLLVELLDEQPLSFEALMEEVGSSLELPEDQDLATTLRHHLQRLSEIGLLEQTA